MKHSHLFSVLFGIGMAGCTVHGQGSMTVTGSAVVDVYQEPPAPRPDTPAMERPGFHLGARAVDVVAEQPLGVARRSLGRRQRAGQDLGRRALGQARDVVALDRGQLERAAGGEAGGEVGGGGTIIANPPRPNPNEGGGGEGGGPVVRDHRDEPATPPTETGPVVRDHRTGGGATVTISATPTSESSSAAPLGCAREASKAGFVWLHGHWNWPAGKWEGVPGHWERERAGSRFVDGTWELQGGTWVWTEGRWDAARAGPVIRDQRH